MQAVTIDCNALTGLYDAQRRKEGKNPKWVRAVEKAYNWLLAQDVVNLDDDGRLLVPSTSTDAVYRAASTCDCPAIGLCWHRAAAWMVKKSLQLLAEGFVFDELAPVAVVPPAPKPRVERPMLANVEVVYAAGDVEVTMARGSQMVFTTRRAGAVIDQTMCAPQSWRKMQRVVVAQARAL
jgi:hypothetical protein